VTEDPFNKREDPWTVEGDP